MEVAMSGGSQLGSHTYANASASSKTASSSSALPIAYVLVIDGDGAVRQTIVDHLADSQFRARIRALLRRSQPPERPAEVPARVRAYRFCGWELNVGLRRLITPQGEQIALSNGEFNLLVAFLSAPQRVLSRDQLLDLSRLHRGDVYDRAIDVQILRLRRKLQRDSSSSHLIGTRRGAGYLFAAPVEIVR